MTSVADKPWHEAQKISTDDGQCGGWFHSWLFGTSRCEKAATVSVTNACVHEHVATVPMCQSCTDGILAQSNFCNSCTDGAESHECPVRITIGPIS